MDNETLLLKLNLQFFAKDGPGGEKTEPATSKKLNDIRKEGQVAKSKADNGGFAYVSFYYIKDIFIKTWNRAYRCVYTGI